MSDQTITSLLNAAADLLAQPGAWTQGAYARDMFGSDVGSQWSDDAVCFCVMGALNQVREAQHDAVILGSLSHAIRAVNGGYPIAEWNDAPGRTQAEVVAALRAAASNQGAA